MAPQSTTEKALQGFANTSELTKQQKGLRSEEVVIKHFRSLRFELTQQRAKVLGVEIDLIFRDSEQKTHFIEVKSRKNLNDVFQVVQGAQKQRILNSMRAWGERKGEFPRAHLVVVVPGPKVQVFWDFLLSWG